MATGSGVLNSLVNHRTATHEAGSGPVARAVRRGQLLGRAQVEGTSEPPSTV